MAKSSIEITDKEYLIKLHKDDFEYSLVRRILNRLLQGNLQGDEELFTPDERNKKYSPELGERFDFLGDK